VYGTDGWAQVGTPTEFDLRCTKLNAGHNHDEKNGPRYDTKYDTLDQCKKACRYKVIGCDAINYSTDKKRKEKFGKCQFQQCKGVIARGKVKDVSSYFLKPGVDRVTKPPIKGCKKTCIGDLTCDEVIKRQAGTETCESLKKNAKCDCTGCSCPKIATTPSTSTQTKNRLETLTARPESKRSVTARCKSIIDCKGQCGGSAHVDVCAVCGGDGTHCSSYSKDDVIQKLSTILPKETHIVAVAQLTPYLALAKGIYRSKDMVRTGNSVTIYMHVIGYAKVTFFEADKLHLRNFLNAQTAVALSKITVVDVNDARWRHSGEDKTKITSAVDITVKLDISQIHDAVPVDNNSNSNGGTSDRAGTVVAIVVVIVILAALLVAGVIIVYRVLDNKKQRLIDNRTLEYEMSDISPRKSNQYIQSSEPPVRRDSTSPKKATVIVQTPP